MLFRQNPRLMWSEVPGWARYRKMILCDIRRSGRRTMYFVMRRDTSLVHMYKCNVIYARNCLGMAVMHQFSTAVSSLNCGSQKAHARPTRNRYLVSVPVRELCIGFWDLQSSLTRGPMDRPLKAPLLLQRCSDITIQS